MVSSRQLILGTSVVAAVVAAGVWLFIGREKNKRKKRRNANGIVTFVDLETKHRLKLIKKVIISPNTRLFRFQLPSNQHVAGLLPGEHIQMSAIIDGKSVTRKYTPASDDEVVGCVDFVIKVYFANQHPNYPKGGVFSQYLEGLDIGDTVEFSGPVTRIVYIEFGDFKIRKLGQTTTSFKHFNSLGILVGGTGITPSLQIINHILKNPEDRTDIWMLFANNSPQDVLLKDKLDALAEKHADQFHVWYTVSLPDETWTYSVGHVNEEMIAKHLPIATEDSGIILCGPPGFKTNAAIPNLLKLEKEMTAYTRNGVMKGIPTFTNPDVVVPLVLTEKIPLSPNTFIFRFNLPSDQHVSGLGPGDHVKIMANIDGKEVSRKYTHVSESQSNIDFLIKIYGPNTHPEYPDGGKLTMTRSISPGPWDAFHTKETVYFVFVKRRHMSNVSDDLNVWGWLPVEAVANAILKDPHDSTEVWLLFANNSPQDVLLKDKLDALAAEYPTRFHVWYTVTAPDANWTYSTGWINKEMLSVYLPSADEDTGVLICGPKGMNNAVIANLKALGYKDEQLVIF
ncbi:Cytochrome-b5 reductase [Aphelenchoides besseyi]|nr:Cytochrome-b5 reductase [Aphelenchoides besseyi]